MLLYVVVSYCMLNLHFVIAPRLIVGKLFIVGTANEYKTSFFIRLLLDQLGPSPVSS